VVPQALPATGGEAAGSVDCHAAPRLRQARESYEIGAHVAGFHSIDCRRSHQGPHYLDTKRLISIR